jgi:hypothetical protein
MCLGWFPLLVLFYEFIAIYRQYADIGFYIDVFLGPLVESLNIVMCYGDNPEISVLTA